MIALPKIRLWDEFWHYRLQPDKEAFAEVIQDWPPGLLVRLKHIIKLRFGDERFTAPSITLRLALLEHLKDRRKGNWHKLLLRLRSRT